MGALVAGWVGITVTLLAAVLFLRSHFASKMSRSQKEMDHYRMFLHHALCIHRDYRRMRSLSKAGPRQKERPNKQPR